MSGRDYGAILRRYCRDVVKGRIVACRWVRLACQRQLDDLSKSRRKGYPYRFDRWHVDSICAFVECMPHVEGEWDSPTIVLEPWQVFWLGTVFGWRRRSDGNRRFNTVYVEVARKNAKSAIASAVALYCLTCEGEVGPQVKTAATTGQQARVVFDVARKMANGSRLFRDEFAVEVFKHAIYAGSSGGSIQPINAKASTQDGLNPHLSIVDELHAHKDRALFDVLKSARGARKNPLSWYVTTAGYNVQGVCYEQRTFLEKVLEGVFDADHYFGVIYTLDRRDVATGDVDDDSDAEQADDEFDERVWIKANPNLGVSVSLEEMRGYASEARVMPDTQTEFLTKRLNVWTSARSGWVNMRRWRRCEGPVELEWLEQFPCYAGLDLAATTDINALVVVWDVQGTLYVWCRFYVPHGAIEPRTERGNVPYRRWLKSGHLIVTPGDVTDYAFIERDIRLTFDRFDLRELAFDPWNAYDLVNRLREDELPLVEYRQGIPSFAAPMKELGLRITAGRLRTAGDPVLRWMASNLIARSDVNENLAPDRKNSSEKIDGMVALLMGLGRSIVQDDDRGTDVNGDYSVVTV